MVGGWYWRWHGDIDIALPGEDSISTEGSEDSPSEELKFLEPSEINQAANDLVEVEL